MPELTEANMKIGRYTLTLGQSMTVRVALAQFYMQLGDEEIREETGEELSRAYMARITEVMEHIEATLLEGDYAKP